MPADRLPVACASCGWMDPFFGTTLFFSDIVSPNEIVFAWLPVRCFDGSMVWLRPVFRRLCIIKPYLANGRNENPWWQYARVR